MTNLLDHYERKEMDFIDLDRLHLDGEQTWLYISEFAQVEDPDPDIDFYLNEYKWVDQNTDEFKIKQEELLSFLDSTGIGTQKQKFDSRTYTRPKKKVHRPGLSEILMQGNNNGYNLCGTKTITKHDKFRLGGENYANPNHLYSNSNNKKFGFSEDLNGTFVKEVPEQCNETFQILPGSSSDNVENSELFSEDVNGLSEFVASKPININLSEPAHNMHNTFNNRFTGSINQNDSFTNISPPSLVSSIAMDGSGTFNSATFSRHGSVSSKRGVNTDINDPNDDPTAQNSLCSSMTTSILDEKEMSTSFLSQAGFPDNESLIGSLSPSMINSFDFNLLNSSLHGSTSLQSRKDTMESSLINSGTFNNMLESVDERLPNGKSKFHLRKSFLKSDYDDQEKINRYLRLNSNCNTDDLSGLAADLLAATEKQENLNGTFQIHDNKENFNDDDSFLLNDGMTDSFIKCTGRESLNMTYHKLPSQPKTNAQKQNDMDQTVLLPNQTFSPRHSLSGLNNSRKLSDSTESTPKGTPKRNATFRKITPPNANLNSNYINAEVDIESEKIEKCNEIDSNKESYVKDDIYDDVTEEIPSPQHDTLHRRKDSSEKRILDGRTMAGSSSDSLEGSSCSERSPPQPTTVPLSMADLEYLAYQQHQSLFQDVSTPIPKSIKSKKDAPSALFNQNPLSPILSHSKDTLSSSTCSNKSSSSIETNKYGTYRLNSSSTGSLNRMSNVYNDGSPRRLSSVKRESSAPEIVGMAPPNRYNPSMQKLGANQNQRILSRKGENFGSDGGLHSGKRSVGGSPSKTLYGSKQGNPLLSPNRTLDKYKQYLQLSGSTTELRPKRSGLPASKLRQYSSHKELNRIPGPPRWSAINGLQPTARSGLHASNPALCPAPLTRQGSYTISVKEPQNCSERRDFIRPSASAKEVMRSEYSYEGLNPKVTNNKINTGSGLQYGQPLKAKHNIPSLSLGSNRNSVAQGAGLNTQSYVKVPSTRQSVAAQPQQTLRPPAQTVNNAQRLPRPSGLPRPSSAIPRKSTLRPPSTYSLAPRPNDQTDCY